MAVTFGVLGPVEAWDESGRPIALRGPRHRAVLGRLLAADGRVVPVDRIVDDLWSDPPEGAVGAVRTFVAALRRALEPDRPPRAPARLLVTEGAGYALRAAPEAVDARRFERTVAAVASAPPVDALVRLDAALSWWRGPAYDGLGDEAWARIERARLAELRLHAVERLAEARLAIGRAAEAVPDLDAHVADHPWREEGWRLLALALYRSGRQGDALAVLRRARELLDEQLGVEPGPELRRLEDDVLHHAERLAAPVDPVERVWIDATAAYDRAVSAGSRARLESTVGLLRGLAVTGGGGLVESRRHRAVAVAAAEELGDAELTARVIGTYDVPAIWTRADDPEQAARVVAAAERTLARLGGGGSRTARARLLATIGLETRGAVGASAVRARAAAREAEELARRLDDPPLLAFALNAVWMQTFERAGLAPQRDEIGAELVTLGRRHGLVNSELLGQLVRMQARAGLGDFRGADRHAAAVDALAERHERPLATVFTRWYRALRLTASPRATEPESGAAYRDAIALLEGAGMPGLATGLPALAELSVRLRFGNAVSGAGAGAGAGAAAPGLADDWGPFEPWARPLVLLGGGRRAEAAAALHAQPEPPHDLLYEAMWALTAEAALALGERDVAARAHAALAPAAEELAGAGSGLVSFGSVKRLLGRLEAALALS
jgi:DNA-binding SARP family transcriptional activator